MLDRHARKHGTGGNVMRKIFNFRHRVNEEKVKAILSRSPAIHWLCNIRLVRGALLSLPYWKYQNECRTVEIRLHEGIEAGRVPDEILKREMPIGSKAYLEVDILFFQNGESAVVFSWNHILFDAKGSALFFDHLNRVFNGVVDGPSILFPEREKKPGIFTYIRNMYRVKAFIQHSSRKPVSSIAPKKTSASTDNSKTLVIPFTNEETEEIHRRGITAGSKFGPTHYYIACCANIVHQLNTKRGNIGPLWIPVPYDGRLKGAMAPVFSTAVSFIFYRLEPTQLKTVPFTVSELSRQMTDQIRIGMPKKYNMLLSMMRHFPLWLYYFLISHTGEGTFSSFLYTSTGDNFKDMKEIMGEPVSGIGMETALTFPPGFTFNFLKFNDCLNLHISYSPEVISNEELIFVTTGIKELLLHS
ncbi:MAG: hypothetical protein IT254_07605 [Chitinophagaceae bacterium]|nr:hypothetical protein [Chitinophagaceae bacterium]